MGSKLRSGIGLNFAQLIEICISKVIFTLYEYDRDTHVRYTQSELSHLCVYMSCLSRSHVVKSMDYPYQKLTYLGTGKVEMTPDEQIVNSRSQLDLQYRLKKLGGMLSSHQNSA